MPHTSCTKGQWKTVINWKQHTHLPRIDSHKPGQIYSLILGGVNSLAEGSELLNRSLIRWRDENQIKHYAAHLTWPSILYYSAPSSLQTQFPIFLEVLLGIAPSIYMRCMCKSLSHVWLFATPWSPPGSSVHGVFPARTLEWVAISSSKESSLPKDQTSISWVSAIAWRFFSTEPYKVHGPSEPDLTICLYEYMCASLHIQSSFLKIECSLLSVERNSQNRVSYIWHFQIKSRHVKSNCLWPKQCTNCTQVNMIGQVVKHSC